MDKIQRANKLNEKGVYKDNFVQLTVVEDLKLASGMLSDALKLPDYSPSLKGAVQQLLGANSTRQAHLEMNEAQGKLTQLVSLAIDIQGSASHINGLGIEADDAGQAPPALSPPMPVPSAARSMKPKLPPTPLKPP